MVELALVITILLVVVFGIVEFGRLFSRYQVFQGAAREGARVAAVRGADWSDAVYAASQPYSPSSAPTANLTCTEETIGEPVTVGWTQSFEISIPFLPDITRDVPIRGVFRCE
ncbi:MAG: TadE/TadG family type IV pilus assembly protein [Actinomycetota bacterium]